MYTSIFASCQFPSLSWVCSNHGFLRGSSIAKFVNSPSYKKDRIHVWLPHCWSWCMVFLERQDSSSRLGQAGYASKSCIRLYVCGTCLISDDGWLNWSWSASRLSTLDLYLLVVVVWVRGHTLSLRKVFLTLLLNGCFFHDLLKGSCLPTQLLREGTTTLPSLNSPSDKENDYA